MFLEIDDEDDERGDEEEPIGSIIRNCFDWGEEGGEHTFPTQTTPISSRRDIHISLLYPLISDANTPTPIIITRINRSRILERRTRACNSCHGTQLDLKVYSRNN